MEMLAAVTGQIGSGSCRAVYSGKASLAIGVPPCGGSWSEDAEDSDAVTGTSEAEIQNTDAEIATQIVWSELPGSDQVFDSLTDRWEKLAGGERRVTLLGVNGRMAGVTTSSRNAATAFRLLAWLSGSEISGELGSASTATMPFRRSQLASAGQWFDSDWSRASTSQLGDVIEKALSRPNAFVIPRIPGVDEYMDALQIAVNQVLVGEAPASLALDQAAAKWEEITNRRGRDAQRVAYLRHLNLAE
jgi:multiple sugar transport system substrate-binding protein